MYIYIYFNSFSDDHWLGLDKIWALTKNKNHKATLRVGLWDFEGNTVYANYQDFWIDNEKTAYQLHVGKYTGTAGTLLNISHLTEYFKLHEINFKII